MAAYGSWPQPVFSQDDASVYFPVFPPPPPPLPAVPQQIWAADSKPSRHHKKHGPGSAKRIVTIQSVNIPPTSPWPTGCAWFLSTLSALMFVCALVFHVVMFFYALETPFWVMLCWPFILVPPIICNSIYLALMAKKEPAALNINMVFLYVVFTISYMAWAVYITATTYNEGRCQEGSYYSLAVSVLALATVACALEWWLTICKIMQRTAAVLNVTMAVYEKCQRKRKLVITMRKDGKIVKEISFNMEKVTQDYVLNHAAGQCMGGTILLYNNSVRCGNDKHKHCPMRYTSQYAADAAEFHNNAFHYEDEKLKQYYPMRYNKQCSAFASTSDKDEGQYDNEKIKEDRIDEYEEDDSSFNNNNNNNNNGGLSNNIA